MKRPAGEDGPRVSAFGRMGEWPDGLGANPLRVVLQLKGWRLVPCLEEKTLPADTGFEEVLPADLEGSSLDGYLTADSRTLLIDETHNRALARSGANERRLITRAMALNGRSREAPALDRERIRRASTPRFSPPS